MKEETQVEGQGSEGDAGGKGGDQIMTLPP